MAKKVLLAGESWMSYTTHVKGFDTFYTSVYETGEKYLKAATDMNLPSFPTIWLWRSFHLPWRS